ncbi:MAG: amino acid ABC transporter permease [Lautropia sp.]|nr:amino acid ABC transporter permease [Lautropia sp.]
MAALEILLAGQNLPRLLHGLGLTLLIAMVSVVISFFLGTGLGLLMRSRHWLVRGACRLYLETVRIVPILVWLFVFYFGLPTWTGWHIEALWVCIVVFSLWGTAEMGDLVRGALSSLPLHQRTSAIALGLSNVQVFFYIEAPQALRRVLPGAINLFTRMLKTTSLAALISVMEVVKVGQQIIERSQMIAPKVPSASFWIYGLIFILYFLVCWPLSWYAARLERRWIS